MQNFRRHHELSSWFTAVAARQRSACLQEPKFAQKGPESRRFPPVAGENALRARLIFWINDEAENFISLKLHRTFFFARILNPNPNAYLQYWKTVQNLFFLKQQINFFHKSMKRQSHNIVIASLNSFYEHCSSCLKSITSCLVHSVTCAHVPFQRFVLVVSKEYFWFNAKWPRLKFRKRKLF